MTYTSLKRTQQSTDRLAVDHLAACPHCGDIAHPTATVCEACGSRLFPTNNERPGSQSLGGDSANRAEEVIVVAPTGCTCGAQGICQKCVLAEYDGDPMVANTVAAHEMLTAALARPANVVPLHRGHSVRVVEAREPTDEEVTRRGPYLMDSRDENDWTL